MNKKEIRKYMSILGKKSANSLTKEQRITRARSAAIKRWSNKKNLEELGINP